MNDATDLLLRIDTYIEELFAPPDPALEGALRRSRAVGLPEIQISPTEGKLLRLLAEIAGVRRILEIGTLGGTVRSTLLVLSPKTVCWSPSK